MQGNALGQESTNLLYKGPDSKYLSHVGQEAKLIISYRYFIAKEKNIHITLVGGIQNLINSFSKIQVYCGEEWNAFFCGSKLVFPCH